MIKKLWHELLYHLTNLVSAKSDQEYTQKTTPAKVNKVKTMSKRIEAKGNRMELSTLALFNHMTDEDFMAVHNAGQLINFCHALTLDLQPKSYEKNNSYSA